MEPILEKRVRQQFCPVSTFPPLKYKAWWNFKPLKLAPKLPTHKVAIQPETANRTFNHNIK